MPARALLGRHRAERHVLFRYTARHDGAAVDSMLAGYQGYLVADAHAMFDHLHRRGTLPLKLLRWTDGELTPSQHATFATIESPNGTRLTPSPDIFSHTARLDSVASNGAGFQRCEAQVVSAGGRAYALIVNHAAGLAGVDTSTGQTLFLVPLRLGETWSLEVADGYPVVRTRFRNSWIATIHDPTSGTIVYRDERPRTPRKVSARGRTRC